MAAPKWNKGADKAQQASEASSGVSGPRIVYFGLKNSGDQAILRFLTEADDWITVMQHMYVPPQRTGLKNPPKAMSCTCRKDEQFSDMYSDCYICDHEVLNLYGSPSRPTSRVWALACLREEIIATEDLIAESMKPGWKGGAPIPREALGTVIGYRDQVREVAELDKDKKPTGRTVMEKALVVVNMSYKNFFGALHGCFLAYRTVLDRDYQIRRMGTGKDVEYHPIPLNPIESLKPGTPSWGKYLENIATQDLDLGQIVTHRSSDDFYAHFFDITKADPWARKDADTEPAQAAQTGAPIQQQVVTPQELDPTMLDAMRARLQSAVPTGPQDLN